MLVCLLQIGVAHSQLIVTVEDPPEASVCSQLADWVELVQSSTSKSHRTKPIVSKMAPPLLDDLSVSSGCPLPLISLTNWAKALS